ncbi:MAG: hypothetical protein JJE30_12575 [Desulfuromonadales bacterium]|nr:hypothetical protein [Desulfuromonadales bacterium]
MPDKDMIEAILKTLGLIGAGFAWAYSTRATLLRSKIKTDLEILEKCRATFGDDDARSRRVELKVSKCMSYLYRDAKEPAALQISPADLFIALACSIPALYLIVISIQDNFQSWQRLTISAVLAFVGIGGFMNAFSQKAAER